METSKQQNYLSATAVVFSAKKSMKSIYLKLSLHGQSGFYFLVLCLNLFQEKKIHCHYELVPR